MTQTACWSLVIGPVDRCKGPSREKSKPIHNEDAGYPGLGGGVKTGPVTRSREGGPALARDHGGPARGARRGPHRAPRPETRIRSGLRHTLGTGLRERRTNHPEMSPLPSLAPETRGAAAQVGAEQHPPHPV
ncbi:hypothetical protein Saso_44680 [Streptomyces asoensis]|uniref:Uncharacterized protein n=1 Tax=Streptomyces asoensis TaxID=249586 RepID=A0ABQ3S3Y7_9ACTN|nr:hypothetical protein GCM10010496_51250 [Streptomyces asoensis]GHI62818.1 hypothetical protein Saso_44680 [Streptomyces asoensis]